MFSVFSVYREIYGGRVFHVFIVFTCTEKERGHRRSGNPFSFSFVSVLKQIGH